MFLTDLVLMPQQRCWEPCHPAVSDSDLYDGERWDDGDLPDLHSVLRWSRWRAWGPATTQAIPPQCDLRDTSERLLGIRSIWPEYAAPVGFPMAEPTKDPATGQFLQNLHLQLKNLDFFYRES